MQSMAPTAAAGAQGGGVEGAGRAMERHGASQEGIQQQVVVVGGRRSMATWKRDARQQQGGPPRAALLEAMRALDLRRICNVRVRHCREAYGVLVESLPLPSAPRPPASSYSPPAPLAPDAPVALLSPPPAAHSTAEPAVEWRLLYSGDCRPSDDLVRLGRDTQPQQPAGPTTPLLQDDTPPPTLPPAIILIHEATFEDEMAEDAVAKKHCTVSEAIDVGRRMDAHRIILTHFSQRYPTIPNLPAHLSSRVLVAFDMLSVSFNQLLQAPASVPVLHCLFPPEIDEDEENLVESEKP